MSVECRVLGSLEVRADGRALDLGPARQRSVLAALLGEVNQPVSVDELLDRVWGDRRPRSARQSLYSYLSRIRHALAPAGGIDLTLQAGRYLLSADQAAVDANRFQDLARQAHAADGDDRALRLFEQALALWRGEAFAGFDSPWFTAAREDLHQLRDAVELDRNEVALRNGHHGTVLPSLTRACALRPLDERLAGQLMLALYLSGRQSDALDHYHVTRQRLGEDVGVYASAALEGLYRQILNADPALQPARRGPRVVDAGSTSVPPRQLPAPLAGFVGRSSELDALDALLARADQSGDAITLVALCGMGGVGKTALAVRWARHVAGLFPGGQLYANLRGFDPSGAAAEPVDVLHGFLSALGVPSARMPVGLEARTALYRSLLADRRVLILLDNARDADQIRPLLAGSGGSVILVTSRNELTSLCAADGARLLQVGVPSFDEARALLAQRLGDERVSADPAAADRIVSGCARLPLAVSIVAARAAARPTHPLSALADELHQSGSPLDALDGGDATANVRLVLSWSYLSLTPQAARLFRLLGLHPGPHFSTPAAASMLGAPIARTLPVLDELVGGRLLIQPSPGRFGFHDLVRAYAGELASGNDSGSERRAATLRLLDHYLHTAHAADRVHTPKRDPILLDPPNPGVTVEQVTQADQALAWFAAEHPVLIVAADVAASHGLDRHACLLARILTVHLHHGGHWHDQLRIQGVALAAAQRLGDRAEQARIHRSLGRVSGRLGCLADARAHAEHALRLFAALDDHVGMAHTHLTLAQLGEHEMRYADALEHCLLALAGYRTAGHRGGQADALNNLGWFHSLLGRHGQALVHCREALEIHRQLNDISGLASDWDSLGHAHRHLGELAEAIACYQEAVQLFQQTGDAYSQAVALASIGDLKHSCGDPAAARQAWSRALEVHELHGHPEAAGLRQKLGAGLPA